MKTCRGALYPRPGHQFVEIDFKSIEVSISCAYHKDSTMIRYMKNKDSDMHADMAKQIFIIDKIDKPIQHMPYFVKVQRMDLCSLNSMVITMLIVQRLFVDGLNSQ